MPSPAVRPRSCNPNAQNPILKPREGRRGPISSRWYSEAIERMFVFLRPLYASIQLRWQLRPCSCRNSCRGSNNKEGL